MADFNLLEGEKIKLVRADVTSLVRESGKLLYRSIVNFVAALIGAILLVSIAAPSARADSATVIINIPNSGLSATPGPYATVSLQLTSDVPPKIDVSVTMFSNFEMFGSGSLAFGFNVVGSTGGLQINGIASNSSNPANVTANLGGGHMNSFGDFQFGINGGPASAAFSSLSFTVSRTGGFSTVAQLMGNSTGGGSNVPSTFAVHVAPTNGNPTGFAGTNQTQVPEPSLMLLLGTGLLGLGILRRRASGRKQQ